MSSKTTKRYPRCCPICHQVRWTRFMDPILVCKNPACRKAAKERGIPVYKFVPWQSPSRRRQFKSPPATRSI